MREQSLAFLRELLNTPSPSGFEARGQRVWLDYVQRYAEETETDAYGNVVAWLNRGGSPRLMLAAHADEIAMTVNFINEQGYLYVRRVGGVDPRSEEHTSELQSLRHLVCRLLLEKKNKKKQT